jgi:hypothetical protein
MTESLSTNNQPTTSCRCFVSTMNETFRQTLYKVYIKFPEGICERLFTSEEKEWFAVIGYESAESFVSSFKKNSCSNYIEPRLVYTQRRVEDSHGVSYCVRVVKYCWTDVAHKDMNLFEGLNSVLGTLLRVTSCTTEEGVMYTQSKEPINQTKREEEVITSFEELSQKIEIIQQQFEERTVALNVRELAVNQREAVLNAQAVQAGKHLEELNQKVREFQQIFAEPLTHEEV